MNRQDGENGSSVMIAAEDAAGIPGRSDCCIFVAFVLLYASNMMKQM